MSTRSKIGILNADGTITAIYCHFDGYVEHNGKILVKHYTTKEKIDELIALGPISELAENINPDPNKPHTFENSQKNVVLAYVRDRGENISKGEMTETYYSIENYLDFSWKSHNDIDYLYLWDGEKWIVRSQDWIASISLENLLKK